MKYLKTFENKDLNKKYKGKIFINTPSTHYFKSSTALQVIFVDNIDIVTPNDHLPSQYPLTYKIVADDTIQCNVGGSINYTDWRQEYVQWEFDKIKFMTTEEFYRDHEELFIRILELAIEDNKNSKNKTDFYKDKLNRIIGKLTIPETEHMVTAEKYNL